MGCEVLHAFLEAQGINSHDLHGELIFTLQRLMGKILCKLGQLGILNLKISQADDAMDRPKLISNLASFFGLLALLG